MVVVHYRITLKEPAILTVIEGEPNSAVSYDFIPGSAIRGFLISAYARQEGLSDGLDPTSGASKTLFFSNDVRYLNAYPLINGQRSLPVPISWRKEKYPSEETQSKIWDEAFEVKKEDECRSGAESDEAKSNNDEHSKKSSVNGFTFYGQEPSVTISKPKRILNVHTHRARRSADEQLVYRYDALAPNQTFAGVILCADGKAAETITGLIESYQNLHIGGARSAGYGLAQIDEVRIEDSWEEVPLKLDQSPVILTLLSDVILRDQHGNFSTTLDALHFAFQPYQMTFEYGDYIALQTTLVGGFNRKWGLPLIQTPALKRGSVIVLHNVNVAEENLADILQYGIGERTNEGFGRVAFNWQQHDTLTFTKFDDKGITVDSPIELDAGSDSYQMWQRLEDRISTTKRSEIVNEVFKEDSYKINIGRLTPTQISRLRVLIAQELQKDKPSTNFIDKFLKHIKDMAAGKRFQSARIDGKSLYEWLRVQDYPSYCKDDREKLWFIDAVLERAHKESRKDLPNDKKQVKTNE